jgi:hypothetical protein
MLILPKQSDGPAKGSASITKAVSKRWIVKQGQKLTNFYDMCPGLGLSTAFLFIPRFGTRGGRPKRKLPLLFYTLTGIMFVCYEARDVRVEWVSRPTFYFG